MPGREASRRGAAPITSVFVGTPWEKVRYISLLAFLLLSLLGGGASRADVLSLLYLRPAAILCLLILLLSPGAWDFGRVRMPLILLGLFAATMAIQLIPLPPGLWASLPGFSRYGEAAGGLATGWHPISLAPDLTLNSLLALLPCLVVIVGFAGIRADQRRALLPLLVGFVASDALLSVAQFAGGPESRAYLYEITNSDSPVGFFANRNHNAVFLALALPLLAVWASTQAPSHQYQRTRAWVAAVFGLFLLALILTIGSRAGMIAGVVGLAAAVWLAPSFTADWDRRWRVALRIGATVLIVLLVVLTIYFDRASSIFRMTDTAALNGELRFEALPVLTDMLRTFSPQGIGYGAFDPVFRGFEPDSMLDIYYFNHAHNDLIELVLTGGIVALLVLVLFLVWWGRQTIRAVLADRRRRGDRLERLGGVIILILLGASVVDYPLRTPLLAVVFTLACCWLSTRRETVALLEYQGTATPDRKPHQQSVSLGRVAVGLVAGGALAVLAFGVTIAAVHGRDRPAVVAWWPLDATAHAIRAARVLENPRPSPAEIAAATEDAQTALRREPVNALAARTLALLAARRGDQAAADRLMRYSESLSRRDLPTQLWMIETSVRRNDIPGALRHYDRALRTSESAADLLYPILISAADSPGVTPELARLLAGRPPWWTSFVERLLAEGRSSTTIATVVDALRLDPADPGDRSYIASAISRLVRLGDYARALSLYRRAGGTASALVHNGDFEAENRFIPLDWVLDDGAGASSIMQPVLPGGGRGLLMMVDAEATGGPVARQLLVLPVGAYRFSATVGRISGEERERPRVGLTCVGNNATLFNLTLPVVGENGQAVAQDFTVSGNACPAQWLIISVPGPTGENGPWIDRVSVQPRP